jgi:mannose-6-phosphate isomerase-like protein (cupin superfamily)
MKMKQLIETYSHTAEGYNPFLIRGQWQVAQLNYEPGLGFGDLTKIDVHLQTDEVFILLKGTAVLIAAEKSGDKVNFQAINIKAGLTYNIPTGMWHNIALSEDAQVIIVENADTHLGDFEYYYLNDKQKKDMDNLIKEQL